MSSNVDFAYFTPAVHLMVSLFRFHRKESSQEVPVGHQLVLGNAGEPDEHLLVFGVGNISVPPGPVSRLADDAAVLRAQNAIAFIGRDGGDGRRRGSRLNPYI